MAASAVQSGRGRRTPRSVLTATRRAESVRTRASPDMYLWPAPPVTVLQPGPERCAPPPPPEGNVKVRNYRVLNDHLRVYTPTGDVNTSPVKGKLVARYEVSSSLAPPRERILELLRPDDPGREALEAIVRPAPRRGLQRPLDEDARRFLQCALHSPSPSSGAVTPDPPPSPPPEISPSPEPVEQGTRLHRQRSLAEELREAEERTLRTPVARGEGVRAVEAVDPAEATGAVERERLGRLALAVEEDEAEGALGAAARRLDQLLAESRALHRELAAIQRDLQVLGRRRRATLHS